VIDCQWFERLRFKKLEYSISIVKFKAQGILQPEFTAINEDF
jgi:hypothetical protein